MKQTLRSFPLEFVRNYKVIDCLHFKAIFQPSQLISLCLPQPSHESADY